MEVDINVFLRMHSFIIIILFCLSIYYAPPRHLKMGEYIVSPLSVPTYVQNIGFSSLSFEKFSLLDSYFIHEYIIIKYRSSSNLGKSSYRCGSNGPFSTTLFG